MKTPTNKEAVEILAELNAKVAISSAEEANFIKGLQVQVIDACKEWNYESVKFFIENFIKIVDFKTDDVIPFTLNRAQRRGLKEVFKAHKKHKGKAWLTIAKARQLGFTTLTNALMVVHSVFYKNAVIPIVAFKEDTAKENLFSIKTMIENLPWWFKVAAIEWDKGATGRHKDSSTAITFYSKVTNTEASLMALSGSAKAIRGKRPTALHWTETAFCDEGYDMYKAIYPSMNRRKNSLMILESTSNGVNNFYADKVLASLSGENNSKFEVIFFPWFDDIDYREDTSKDFVLTDEERELKQIHSLDNEQIMWRRTTIADNDGNVRSFHQEYPSTVEESFVALDNRYFDKECLDTVEGNVTNSPQYRRFELLHTGIASNEFGNTQVWDEPNPSYQYMISVDVAEGGKGGDFTVATVIDPFGTVVATYRSEDRPDITSGAIAHLGTMYNKSMIVVERNGVGSFMINALQYQLRYPNLFRGEDGKTGFRTTEPNRKRILAQLQEELVEQTILIRWTTFLEETRTFEVNNNGKPVAKTGCHDDTIMALAIGVEAKRMYPLKIIDPDNQPSPPRRRKFTV